MFKKLSNIEKEEYRKWARENYIPNETISNFWHPVVQMECININQQQNEKTS